MPEPPKLPEHSQPQRRPSSARWLARAAAAFILVVLAVLLAAGFGFLFQPDVQIEPFATAPKKSGSE